VIVLLRNLQFPLQELSVFVYFLTVDITTLSVARVICPCVKMAVVQLTGNNMEGKEPSLILGSLVSQDFRDKLR